MPAFAWHRCLPAHTGGRNTPCSSGRKPLQKNKAFSLLLPFPRTPWWEAFGSFLMLFGTLLPSLAFKYHGTPCRCSQFLPFSPLGISTFSSLDAVRVPAALSFSFLPLSSGTRAPALPHGPKSRLPGGPASPRASFPSQRGYHARHRRCQGWKCPPALGVCADPQG